MGTMTLKLQELRDRLQALLDQGTDPGTHVHTEGCDCDGEAVDVVVENGSGEYIGGEFVKMPIVYIKRQK